MAIRVVEKCDSGINVLRSRVCLGWWNSICRRRKRPRSNRATTDPVDGLIGGAVGLRRLVPRLLTYRQQRWQHSWCIQAIQLCIIVYGSL